MPLGFGILKVAAQKSVLTVRTLTNTGDARASMRVAKRDDIE